MRATVLGRPLRGVAFDVAVSGAVALLALASTAGSDAGWPGTMLGLGMAVALLWRRVRPVGVTVVVAVLAYVQVALDWAPLPYDVAVLIALYSLVKYADRLRDGVLAGVVAALGVVFAAARTPSQVAWAFTAVFYGLVVGAVWLAALNVRTRRLYVLSLEDRAATLEREREAQSRAAVAEERTRIARELHDVVAHGMAVMIVQADGARYVIDKDPQAAREAVRIVADTGRQALADMRRLVDVLREPSRPDPATGPEPAPGSSAGPDAAPDPSAGPDRVPEPAEPTHRRPSVAELPALLERFRAAGLQVSHTVTGDSAPLPPALDLTVYRLVQEALTNTLKHAGVGATAEVSLAHRADAVVLEVLDDGRGRVPATPAPPGGHGLVGMRERVSVYDGSLTAGPRPTGGWLLRARLPLPSSSGTEVVTA
ncbi:sensor histidine kinase [Micromonospora sp. NPDC047793]|uniref:sensor histidine kinase n=1 Tax=Micromonospora sp. NPDC047793 TaxID=3154342 RepID=UPI0033F230E4